jgi:hydroxymethylpyrimidine/phosphomethylpyrimidine kinase
VGAPARRVSDIPRTLTIAGSDSGGGAGIQADLKTFFVLGCHGMSALTALTAQNTVGVTRIHPVPIDFVAAQIDAVATDIGVDAAKTGMLASGEIIEAVAAGVRAHGIAPLVVDPVFVSKSRDHLLAADAVDTLKKRLLPLATIITPNLYETEGLLGGSSVTTVEEMRKAARALYDLGPQAVLVKGGHLPGDGAIDVFFDGDEVVEIVGPRYDTEDTHGTGCTLSSAIAARLARGDDLLTAVRAAKAFTGKAIERGLRIGKGYGPVNQAWGLTALA